MIRGRHHPRSLWWHYVAAFIIGALAVLLSGCTTSAVILRHPDGRVVECGPYLFMYGTGPEALRDCVRDYQRQGYERAPR